MSQRSLSSAATSIVTQPPWKAVRPPPRPLPRPPRAAALALGPSVSAPPAIQVAPDAPNLHLPPRPRTPPPPYTFLTADDDGFDEEEEEEYDLAQFLGLSLLSHAAVQLRDKVPRDTHVKHGIPYPRCFTGKDIVTTLHSQIEWDLENRGISMNDRGPALQVARSLQSQLFFYDVEWGGRILEDRMEDVYALLDDEGEADSELPTAVVTMLTRCYSPSCGEDVPCYAYSCPNKGVFQMLGLSEALQMNAVDTIVSNHDQRGALLTQAGFTPLGPSYRAAVVLSAHLRRALIRARLARG
ncbi:hypothetical protein FB451DRAFT_375542 [Mycena latifolia]|nr:hypothetical protein FB451DRAFT_375542 [Mycena latifolia]